MRLKQKIVDQIKNEVACRRHIAEKLNTSDIMIYRYLLENKQNGRLTRMDALMAIAAEVNIKNVMDLVENGIAA